LLYKHRIEKCSKRILENFVSSTFYAAKNFFSFCTMMNHVWQI